MKKLAWLSVEDYGTTPMEIVVASVMNGYLRRLPEQEALKKVENIIEPKVIQLFGEGGAPMPVQSHIDGAKFAAFIDEAVADSIRELENRKDDLAGASIAVLQNVVGESIVENMSPEFVGFLGDAYRSLKYTACITGLEDVVYVHVMFNNDLKRIVVRGCDENDKDALRWCIAKPDKRKSRKMSCKPFAELVYKEMDWDSECRYKVLGYRITFEGETLYVFDLLVPEIFHDGQKRKKGTVAEQPADQETKPVNTRKGFYPDDIAGTFGVPVEEHLRESEVRQMDGYVSMGVLTGRTVPDTGLD